MPAARILVQLSDGENVIHEFRRSTTLHQTDSLKNLIRAAMGWMQAYGDQATLDQWTKDIERLRHGQPIR